MSERTSVIPEAYAAYLDDERSAGAPRAAKDAVLRRLEASLPGLAAALDAPDAADDASGPADASVAGSGESVGRGLSALAGHPWLRAIGLLALGGVAGFTVHARLASPKVVYVDRVVAPVASASAPAERTETVISVSSLPTVVASAPSSKAARASAPLDRESTLAVERGLLDRARSAVMRGDTSEAERTLREHEARFSRGELREERDALVIKVLARGGRIDEARARAERFRGEFPHSLLLMGIDAELR